MLTFHHAAPFATLQPILARPSLWDERSCSVGSSRPHCEPSNWPVTKKYHIIIYNMKTIHLCNFIVIDAIVFQDSLKTEQHLGGADLWYCDILWKFCLKVWNLCMASEGWKRSWKVSTMWGCGDLVSKFIVIFMCSDRSAQSPQTGTIEAGATETSVMKTCELGRAAKAS